MKKIVIVFLASLIFMSCGPTVQYVGRSLPPTTNVDIYFDTKDIQKQYEVIGRMNAKDWQYANYEAIKNKIVIEAKKRGADGVIITNMGQQVTGSTQNTNRNSNGGLSTTTSTQSDKVMWADLIKYK